MAEEVTKKEVQAVEVPEAKVLETEARENGRRTNSMKKTIIGMIALVAVIIALLVVYFKFGPQTVKGTKAITIEVVDNEQKSTLYDINTDAEYLRQAMEEVKGLNFDGTESEYGMMVESVNGVKADANVDGAYWCFYVNGEYCNYGIDTQPVQDGDAFQIKYEIFTY